MTPGWHMNYLVAAVLPALAMFRCTRNGKLALACLLLQLTLIGWIPAMLWAFTVVSDYNAESPWSYP